MAGIFTINWNTVAKNLIPNWWRTKSDGSENTLIAFNRCTIAPIQDVSNDLDSFRDSIIELLYYSGQNLGLQALLNDRYDSALNRIYIEELDNPFSNFQIDLYLQGETNPEEVDLYLQSETAQFDISASYIIGDRVAYNNILYVCTTNTGPGAFTPAHWSSTGGTTFSLYLQGESINIYNFTVHAPAADFPADFPGEDEVTVSSWIDRYKETTKTYDFNYF